MKRISFSKYEAAGNDFVIFDNRKASVKNLKALAIRLCDRKHGIGADGLIALEKSKSDDVQMRIINPDGSEAEMCGNGVRCLARFAVTQKITKNKFSVETLAGSIGADVRENVVKAKLSSPKDLKLRFLIEKNSRFGDLNFVNTGVPHVVKVLESVERVDADRDGREIREHAYFKPRGTNVNFISMRSGNAIDVRTYERGVEAETLACGTGSTASALVAAAIKDLKSPVSVKTKGGEILKVYFSRKGLEFYDVFLEGKVNFIFDGGFAL